MTPAELMRAILLAPVDLLWNGGIGTYVKASDETHADAGDKANDGIRVDGRDLRAQAIGEGGNLGCTQRGRIEYAREGVGGAGGRMNTDFIDNSAGVDTSDHEVNLKILLDRVVKSGDMTREQRNSLLAEMTDEVAGLVLARQLRAEPRPRQRRRARAVDAARARGVDAPAGAGRRPGPRARGAAHEPGGQGPPRPRRGPERPRAGGAAVLDQDRARRRAAGLRPARRPVPRPGPAGVLPDRGARGFRAADPPAPAAPARSS